MNDGKLRVNFRREVKSGGRSGGAGMAPKWVYRFTLRRTLEEDCTPFAWAITGRSPSGAEGGTCTAIWYSPGFPGEMAAPNTVAAMLPMVAVTGFATLASGFEGGTIPGVTVGVVAPNPVPHRTIHSPGFAGTVVTPGNRPAGAAGLKSGCVATAYFPLHRKNPGDTACNCAVPDELAEPLKVTSTGTGPSALSAGAWTLICAGLMKATYAGLPSILTLTPSRWVGSAPPSKSSAPQDRVLPARFEPWMVTPLPAETPGWKLAALNTPPVEIAG